MEGVLYTIKISENPNVAAQSNNTIMSSRDSMKLILKLASSNIEIIRLIRAEFIEQMELKRLELNEH